jgi:hypothetical protein
MILVENHELSCILAHLEVSPSEFTELKFCLIVNRNEQKILLKVILSMSEEWLIDRLTGKLGICLQPSSWLDKMCAS